MSHTWHYTTLQYIATYYSTLQHTATHCNTPQHFATHCNTLQHTASHCNTLPSHASITWHVWRSAARVAACCSVFQCCSHKWPSAAHEIIPALCFTPRTTNLVLTRHHRGYAHTCTFIHMHTYSYPYIHIRIHTHIWPLAWSSYSYPYIHIRIHTHIWPLAWSSRGVTNDIYIPAHSYIYIRIYTYTYISIYMHTYDHRFGPHQATIQDVRLSLLTQYVTHIRIHMHHAVTREWVMSQIWMSHVSHMNESCLTYKDVLQVNASCHTYDLTPKTTKRILMSQRPLN